MKLSEIINELIDIKVKQGVERATNPFYDEIKEAGRTDQRIAELNYFLDVYGKD